MSARAALRLAAVALCLLLSAGGLEAGRAVHTRPPPQFLCKRYIQPRVQCESKYTWPVEPIWRVYVPETDDVADYDDGIVVFLTLPAERFARIEMCWAENGCISAYGGWFGSRLFFRREHA